MTTEIRPAHLVEERELLQSKFFAYVTNPTLRERQNLEDALDHYELVLAQLSASNDDRRKDRGSRLRYIQLIGRAKRPGGNNGE